MHHFPATRLGIIALILGAIAGCTGSGAATMTFIDRTNGQTFVGSTLGRTTSGQGQMMVDIEGFSYTGQWIYAANSGGVSAVSGSAFGKGGAAFGTATGISISAVGGGLITMRTEYGNAIRCGFNFNSLSNTGYGECERNDGRQYDLMIKR